MKIILSICAASEQVSPYRFAEMIVFWWYFQKKENFKEKRLTYEILIRFCLNICTLLGRFRTVFQDGTCVVLIIGAYAIVLLKRNMVVFFPSLETS